MSFRKNIKFNTKKVRRGRRKSAKNISKSLRFLGVNSAGLKSKLNTFRKVLFASWCGVLQFDRRCDLNYICYKTEFK